jgi:hypothetical protein
VDVMKNADALRDRAAIVPHAAVLNGALGALYLLDGCTVSGRRIFAKSALVRRRFVVIEHGDDDEKG